MAWDGLIRGTKCMDVLINTDILKLLTSKLKLVLYTTHSSHNLESHEFNSANVFFFL